GCVSYFTLEEISGRAGERSMLRLLSPLPIFEARRVSLPKRYILRYISAWYIFRYILHDGRRPTMFGMRHSCGSSSWGGRWAAGRGWRGRHRHGWGGGRHGWDGEMMRAGRMLAQGDLRLIALALIAEQPRHGYEIIKVLEDKTAGWY